MEVIAPLSRPSVGGGPASLSAFRNLHRGETVVVCGCGRSLNAFSQWPYCVTIGVNDVGRRFDPTYLVVVNPPGQFSGDRFRFVADSRARFLFTQRDDLGRVDPPLVKFRLGRVAGTHFDDPEVLHYAQNSPYVALCLAAHMGATRIGLIGIDFTEHHFFSQTGVHPLSRQLAVIDRQYAALRQALRARGITVVNLSSESRLTAFPKEQPKAFLSDVTPRASATQSLSIVSYATSPVAGVPAILARCINAATPHGARCVWATNNYGNGVVFDGDVEWSARAKTAEVEALIADADVVIAHNGKIDERHRALVAGKPIVTMAHNYAWNVDTRFVKQGMPGLVVGQYQATLPEFAGWTPVPNPVPLWETMFSPARKGDVVTIAFTPSGRHETYPEDHRLFWHGKGYETTMRVLDTLARRHHIEVIAIKDRQMSHADALAAKRRAHIVIDECVTGSYHRNSLEGLACGAVVVNGVGILPSVARMLVHCAGDAQDLPFTHASCGTLETVLDGLISSGPEALIEAGQRNRAWLEKHWDFGRQWQTVWHPEIERAIRLTAHAGGRCMRNPEPQPSVITDQAVRPISIVIPHRGADRLPLLNQTLRTLNAHLPEGEIIVAEVATRPLSTDAVRDLGAIHLRLPSDGAFERAWALNAGSAIASNDLIVWHDNDLIAGPDFFVRAAAEMVERNLDYLVPYTCIHYLSSADSAAVMRGERPIQDCRPIRRLIGGRDASGGMGIVHRRFLERFGGFSQEFRGWGGEDNFWWKKATLLGRAGVTGRADQTLWHLYHEQSGALTRQPPRNNEHYRRNVAVLREAAQLNTPERFNERFPCPPADRCPFPAERGLCFVYAPESEQAELAMAMAGILEALYSTRPRLVDAKSGWSGKPRRATVLFGPASLLERPASDETSAPVILMASAKALRSCLPVEHGFRLDAIVTDATPQQLSAFGFAGAVWRWKQADAAGPEAWRVAVALIQALSHIDLEVQAAPDDKIFEPVRRDVPVWLYWEGELPEWIAQCQRTIRKHAPNAQILNAASFDVLWDRDRDIQISHLLPAQRADFIRAFLLARHGGIWLDSDCLLMRRLDEIQDLLRRHDFVAHRDRQDYFPNGFMAAPPGSEIAAAFYDRVRTVLRAGRPLGWISLGGEPLTQILRTTKANWHELPCTLVQPICWSEPEAFFAQADHASHAARFDRRALTYMLSNTQILSYQRKTAGKDLLADGTFFRFLLSQSLGSDDLIAATRPTEADDRRQTFASYHYAGLLRAEETLSGPGSTIAQTAVIARRLPALLKSLGVRSLLDAGCGDFNWIHRLDLNLDRYVGVDIVADLIALNRRRHSGPRRDFACLDFACADLPRADAVLSRDTLVHYPLDIARAALRNIRRSGADYLIVTTFPGRGLNEDIPLGGWRPLDMEAAPFSFPPPLHLIVENCTEMNGRYADKSLGVWALPDLADLGNFA
jgi:SAM-dependent methyltransferase